MLKDFISLIFPVQCAGCGNVIHSSVQVICSSCQLSLPYFEEPYSNENKMAEKFWGKVELEGALALFKFNQGGLAQSLIHQVKYKHAKELGIALGRLLGNQFNSQEVRFDCVVPVPLHRKKKRIRGFNQSELIAQGVGDAIDSQVSIGNLNRVTYTETQTNKGLFDRWKNVETVFEVVNCHTFEGKHILLVDDVITTGATLEACVHALKKSKDVKISVATLAITV